MAGPIKVPYQAQHDNASGAGHRECFSSSVAMLLMTDGHVQDDNAYNRIRARFGDTTDPQSHLRAVRSLGLSPDFKTDWDRAMVEQSIKAGRPVAVGWLHRGTLPHPNGFGHWSVIIASSSTHLLLHDPAGEPDLVVGGHISGRSGAAVKCSWRNFLPRWCVEGPSTGYAFTIRSRS